MAVEDVFKIAGAIIASLGGGVLLIAVFSNWLGRLWAKRMLQNERAKHSEKLESLKAEFDLLKQQKAARHFDKITIYKDIVHLISEILREFEAIATERQSTISPDVERGFALNRHKAYGYVSLSSNQAVMDRYNDLMDFFLDIIYDGKRAPWEEMRGKADALLNEMRRDLGIGEGDIIYQGNR